MAIFFGQRRMTNKKRPYGVPGTSHFGTPNFRTPSNFGNLQFWYPLILATLILAVFYSGRPIFDCSVSPQLAPHEVSRKKTGEQQINLHLPPAPHSRPFSGTF